MQFANSNVNYNIDFGANITKDSFGNGNSRSTVFIYNLSEDKRNTLESLVSQSKLSSMQFMIEYSYMYSQDQYQIITYDDVVGIYNELGENDYKTNLILKSGMGSLVKTFSSASYPPNTAASTILDSECKKLIDGNGIKNYVMKNIIDHIFPYGFTAVGNVYNYLKKLCYETDNTLFVDKGTLIVAPAQWLIDSNAYQRDLNFSNGLLEPPHIGQNNFTKKYKKNQSSVSFMFKSMLLPEVSINDVISVLGQKYTVKRINHVIESREGTAYSIIEGFLNGSV